MPASFLSRLKVLVQKELFDYVFDSLINKQWKPPRYRLNASSIVMEKHQTWRYMKNKEILLLHAPFILVFVDAGKAFSFFVAFNTCGL